MLFEFEQYIGSDNNLLGYARSNRLVLLKVLFDFVDLKNIKGTATAPVRQVAIAYRDFYLNRKKNSLIVDYNPDEVIAHIETASLSDVLVVINRHPYRLLKERGFLHIIERDGVKYFSLNDQLVEELTPSHVDKIKRIIDNKLVLYYERIDSTNLNIKNSGVLENSSDNLNEQTKNTFHPSGDTKLVNFSSTQKYSHQRPVYCKIEGVELATPKDWAQLLVSVCEYTLKNHPEKMKAFYLKPLIGNSHAFIMQSNIIGVDCAKLTNGYWINISYTIPSLVQMIKDLCRACQIPAHAVYILYQSKKEHAPPLPFPIKQPLVEAKNNNVQLLFLDWLVKTKSYSQLAAKNYISAVSYIGDIAIRIGIIKKHIFLISDIQIIKEAIICLQNNEEFIKLNEAQLKRFSFALELFMDFTMREVNLKTSIHSKLTNINLADYSKSVNDFATDDVDNQPCFFQWLIDEKGYTEAKAKNLTSAIKSIGNLILRNGILDMHLFKISNVKKIERGIRLLQSSKQYTKFDEEYHNIFSNAIKQFLDFIYCNNNSNHVDQPQRELPKYILPKANIPPKASLIEKSEIVSLAKIECYVKKCNLAGCKIEDIVVATRMPATIVIRSIETNINIVSLSKERLIHKDNVVDLDEAAHAMLRILSIQFDQFDGYSNCRLLFEAIRIEMCLFINDNNFDDIDVIYALAKHLFSKEQYGGNSFYFYNTHIWKQIPNYPQTLKGLLINKARRNNGLLNRSDVEDYTEKIRLTFTSLPQVLQLNTDNTFLQYKEAQYLLIESLGVDTSWEGQIKKALDGIFEEVSYVIPRDIQAFWYQRLPTLPVHLSWNPLLLQEIIQKYDKIGYRLISAPLNQSIHTICAAIVPKDSPFTSFADVVSAFLSAKIQLPKKMQAEELRLILREAGMLDGNELFSIMHKALNDYRFAWTDENKTVFVRSN